MVNPQRKHTPTPTETSVLAKSARRCGFCFYLEGDLQQKHGQIAHLDQDPSNFAEDNLAFLCMAHHSEYDSKTSQHKNYTIGEAKAYRTLLYQAIASGKHHPDPGASIQTVSHAAQEADKKTLATLQGLLPNKGGIDQLRGQPFWFRFPWAADAIFRLFLRQASDPETRFLDPGLEALRMQLYCKVELLVDRVHRFSDPIDGDVNHRRFLHLDSEPLEAFEARRDEVYQAAKDICQLYDDLILTARRRLI